MLEGRALVTNGPTRRLVARFSAEPPKDMLETEKVSAISDEMRAVVESEWPELGHKLPPKKPR
jgi:hypothetical protein